MKKTILVTGGAGFVGSHLCMALIKRGNRLICLDNLSTGRLVNIAELQENEAFTLVEGDVCNGVDMQVDEIYNLACPASPPHYQHHPIQTMRTSVLGALSMLELAQKWGAKILQASTSEIYGDPLVHPQGEDYWGHVNPIGPRACYDEGKRCAETLFFDSHREKGVQIKVARIFNTYGPRMDEGDGRVISNFICQALKQAPITLYGDGTQTRSFCYVDDLVAGLIALMESDKDCTGPINLGNPNERTIAALAEKIVSLTGSSSELVYRPLPQDDPKMRCPSIERAKTLLDWEPRISLEEGLMKTIQYFTHLRASC